MTDNPLMSHASDLFRQAVATLAAWPGAFDPQAGLAQAHNFLHDMRPGEARAKAYHEALDLEQPTVQELMERHFSYVKERIWDAGSHPDTFHPAADAAMLGPLDGKQDLIRVEVLERPLTDIDPDPHEAFRLLDESWRHFQQGPNQNPKYADARAFLETWLEKWNKRRDNRPVFATFADSMAQEMQENQIDGWPQALGTRLGLAHIGPRSAGERCYVALMRYRVREVMDAARPEAAAFAAPTVLDSEMWEYFFPAPVDPRLGERASYGRSLRLAPITDTNQLTAELLHIKMRYQPGHIHKLGWLDEPFTRHPLRDLRNAHLDALRIETELEDFGELMP